MKILRLLAANLLLAMGIASTLASAGGGMGGAALADIFTGFVTPAFPPGPPPVPVPRIDISVANAPDVAAAVVQASSLSRDLTAKLAGQLVPPLPSAPDLLSGESKVDLFRSADATGLPATGDCVAGGTVTVTGSPGNDPITLSERDFFQLVFAGCDDGAGYSIDGELSASLNELTGDPFSDVFQLAYNVHNIDITVTTGADFYRAEEQVHIGWDSRSFPAISLTNKFLPTLTSEQDSFYWYSGSQLLGLDASVPPEPMVAEDSSSRLESTLLGGTILYETVVPLVSANAQVPESGELLVTDQVDGGTIRIVIESSNSVRLEIDEDGDGILEDIQFTTWAALHE